MKAHIKHEFIAVSMLSLFLVGCSNQVSESVVETIPPVTEEQKKTVNTLESEDVTYTVTEGKGHTNTLGSLSLTAKENYFAVEFPCEGKDTFQVSFEVADTSLLGFAIANKQKVVIKQFNPYKKMRLLIGMPLMIQVVLFSTTLQNTPLMKELSAKIRQPTHVLFVERPKLRIITGQNPILAMKTSTGWSALMKAVPRKKRKPNTPLKSTPPKKSFTLLKIPMVISPISALSANMKKSSLLLRSR